MEHIPSSTYELKSELSSRSEFREIKEPRPPDVEETVKAEGGIDLSSKWSLE